MAEEKENGWTTSWLINFCFGISISAFIPLGKLNHMAGPHIMGSEVKASRGDSPPVTWQKEGTQSAFTERKRMTGNTAVYYYLTLLVTHIQLRLYTD